MFTEETSDGARSSGASANRSVVRSEESGRTAPRSVRSVGERRNRHSQLLKAEVRENRLQEIGDVIVEVRNGRVRRRRDCGGGDSDSTAEVEGRQEDDDGDDRQLQRHVEVRSVL